jgi:hypothetical protein
LTVATSLGDTFEDDSHFAAYQWDPKTFAPTDSLNTTQASPYDTKLSPEDELKYSGKFGPDASRDYDMRGYFQANPDVQPNAEGVHYPDTYKKPNHMTFSDESVYHGKDGNQGGSWGMDEQGKDTFTPGPTNLQTHTPDELRDYFQKVEPNVKLIMPPGSSTEPAGALKSSEAPKVRADNIDAVRAPFGVMSEGEIPEGSLQGQVFSNRVKGIVDSAISAATAPGDALSGKLDPSSEEGVRRVTEMAGWMVGAPAPVASKLADGTLGSFAGVTSKTINKEALYRAQNAELEGIHPDQIWQDTGFFRGADNRWRFEIPDDKAVIGGKGVEHTITPATEGSTGMGWTEAGGNEALHTISIKPPRKNLFGNNTKDSTNYLPDVLQHPELYKAYPELKNVKIAPYPEELSKAYPKSLGSFSAADNTIYLKKDLDPEYAKGIILHEAQHKIQSMEGFARGGNTQEFVNPALMDQAKKFEETSTNTFKDIAQKNNFSEDQVRSLKKAVEMHDNGNTSPNVLSMVRNTPKEDVDRIRNIIQGENIINNENQRYFELYNRLMGEVEARNVQTRMDFNNTQRGLQTPRSTEDRPRFVQIQK